MITDHSVIQEVLAAYYEHPEFDMVEFDGAGTNNTTRLIRTQDSLYVLRIYESHQDQVKIRYEHSVLLALSNLDLPFKTPVPQRNLQGDTFAILSKQHQGKIAALFAYSEGHNPQFRHAAEIVSFGESIAELSRAMNQPKFDQQPVYPPYYQLEASHPACPMDKLANFCANAPDPFRMYADKLQVIGWHIEQSTKLLPLLQRLPHQLIHGDLNRTNVLVDDTGMICAILDFEFVTWDLRVMELAVALTDVCNPAAPTDEMWSHTRSFLSGYCARATLTNDELQVIPLLITLRKLDVFIHFLGRYWEGVNDATLVIRFIDELYVQLVAAEDGLRELGSLISEMCSSK